MDRKSLTFEQAEGAEPLPSQLATRTISQELRVALWDLVLQSMVQAKHTSSSQGRSHFNTRWQNVLRRKHVERDKRFADQFQNDWHKLKDEVRAIFVKGSYLEVLGLVQWLLRTESLVIAPEHVDAILKQCRTAYRVVGGDTIAPITSDEEVSTLQRAFADVRATEFGGAQAHLRNASQLLTESRYADSIRESVHAVEAVARTLLSEPKIALGDALKKLDKSLPIHPALKGGFEKLYGFTSDENGIRV